MSTYEHIKHANWYVYNYFFIFIFEFKELQISLNLPFPFCYNNSPKMQTKITDILQVKIRLKDRCSANYDQADIEKGQCEITSMTSFFICEKINIHVRC